MDINKNNTKTSPKSIEVIISTRIFMFILTIVGVVLYVLVQMYISVCTNNKVIIPTFINISLNVIIILSGTFISTGVLSFFLGITSIKQNIQETVLDTYSTFSENILNCDFNIDNYNDELLENLKKKMVIKSLKNQNMDCSKLDNSVYSMEKNLVELVRGLYYEYHDMTTVLIPDLESKTIKKKITVEYNVVNINKIFNQIKFQIGFYKNSIMTEDQVKFTLFQINKVVFTTEDIETYKKMDSIDINGDKYYIFTFERELHDCDEHTIRMEYEYDIPIEDLTHTFKIPLPCKKLNHNFIISGKDTDNWNLDVNAFTSWFHVSSPMEREFRVISQTKQNSEIKFSNWSLPGAGYVISLAKESSKERVIL